MQTILIPVAFTLLSLLLAHVMALRDSAEYGSTVEYMVRALYYASALSLSGVVWLVWAII